MKCEVACVFCTEAILAQGAPRAEAFAQASFIMAFWRPLPPPISRVFARKRLDAPWPSMRLELHGQLDLCSLSW